ncbi:putative mannosyltransferase-II [Trypanosoma conorhini]|uniref:GPI mannosyltransferase 2 n=1 Tax=Trypanosoma conorhini TaxID=83891 RepID=A0A3R7N5Z7_9TRYP|nr:putative mannosyltransferase-II [Trypanosoma conorhini]RNF25954.1 putative mannosyltransferase-II [Trypanosoma conorhini]
MPSSFAVVPVSFQVALLNTVLNGVSAIFLRRITVATLLRPKKTEGGKGVGGTWLDELPPPPPPRHGGRKGEDREEDVRLRLRREVGAVLLMWLMSPTAVFTVVAYTESIFSCLTFAGLHFLLLSSEESRSLVAATKEAGAVFCFSLAGWARSNALLYVGFLLYPIFLQVFFFNTYRRRCIQCHGSSKLCRRWPSIGRCVVLLLEILAICAPYLCMTYFCFTRFVPLWDSATKLNTDGHFWSFYGWIQKRYWDVGFLASYRMKNLSNVFIAAPIVFFALRGFLLFHVLPVFAKVSTSVPNESAGSGNGGRRNKAIEKKTPRSYFTSTFRIVEGLVQSSNTVYLVAVIFIGVTMVHVNVVNRFIMSSPALYWIWARQLVWDPWGGCTIVMLRIFAAWTCIGALFFPNGMPWT